MAEGDVMIVAGGISAQPIKYKYSEDLALAELAQYLASTYSGHYKSIENDIQTIDVWEALGSVESSCRDVGIKYLMRYGKKEGFNRKDILKAIHYCIFLLHFNSKRKAVLTGSGGGSGGSGSVGVDVVGTGLLHNKPFPGSNDSPPAGSAKLT